MWRLLCEEVMDDWKYNIYLATIGEKNKNSKANVLRKVE